VKLEVPRKTRFLDFELAQRVRAQAPQNRRSLLGSLRDNCRIAWEPRKARQLNVEPLALEGPRSIAIAVLCLRAVLFSWCFGRYLTLALFSQMTMTVLCAILAV
jgi:hypothetical protein